MDLTDLHVFWYVLLGVLVTGYAILDGFDLGVGILHPLVKGDRERRVVLNSIGPLWDGNEVWLVTFGGALFAAFPRAYASLFSAFYLPFMVLLFALIGRAVSIEFRSKVKAPGWRTYWDHSFAFSSLMVVLLFGVAAGNLMQGLPLDANGDLVGDVRDLLRPYPFAVGLLAVITAALHGSLYLHLKTEGALQERIGKLRWPLFGAFLIAYLGVTIATLVLVPHATKNFDRFPIAWVVVVLNALAVANVPRAIHHGKPGQAFLSSCALIAALVFLFGMAMFPKLALSSLDPAYDLDAWNAASSESTLGLMRWIALLGMP
ncbi:MAG: cytochrome d ubiquinol oxidase subunit II, partial [Myxococcales bacterium]|nr:cytochrome d ubiquinol oxidase subunit II [Myxococcales bacterium]